MKKKDWNGLLAKANEERELGSLNESETLYVSLLDHKDQFDIHLKIHVYLGLAKTYKLQYQQTKQARTRQLMEQRVAAAEALLDVASEEDKILILENVAEVAALNGDWDKARYLWEQVLADTSIGDAYAGRAYGHKAEALYHLNQLEEALADARRGIMLLRKAKVAGSKQTEYVWKVWYSGVLMKLFAILRKMNSPEAEIVSTEVEEVLQDTLLTHRRRQWKELQEDLHA